MKLACTVPAQHDERIIAAMQKLKLPNNNQFLMFAVLNLIERMEKQDA
jgi:hypothetical protein